MHQKNQKNDDFKLEEDSYVNWTGSGGWKTEEKLQGIAHFWRKFGHLKKKARNGAKAKFIVMTQRKATISNS